MSSKLALGFFSFAAPSGIVQVLACAPTRTVRAKRKLATTEEMRNVEAGSLFCIIFNIPPFLRSSAVESSPFLLLFHQLSAHHASGICCGVDVEVEPRRAPNDLRCKIVRE